MPGQGSTPGQLPLHHDALAAAPSHWGTPKIRGANAWLHILGCCNDPSTTSVTFVGPMDKSNGSEKVEVQRSNQLDIKHFGHRM